MTPLIFELEHRSKARNEGNRMGYLGVGSTSGTTCGSKDHPDLKLAAILKFSTYLRHVHFESRYVKIIANFAGKRIFDTDDVTA